MKSITGTDLTGRTNVELAVLFQMASEALAATEQDTRERRAIIGNLQNISRERARRHLCSRTPGF